MHRNRIERSRDYLTTCSTDERLRIIELGCGTLDISGPFSDENEVWGMECNIAASDTERVRTLAESRG